jgi:hypothetical protein
MKHTEPRKINEVVDKDIRYDLEGELSSVINKLQSLQEEHAKNYLSLQIDIFTESDYDYSYAMAQLIGYRMETQEEVAKRIQDEKEYKQKIKERDLKELERLKKQYESNTKS